MRFRYLLVGFFLLASACGGSSSVAATVNGSDITVAELEDLVAGTTATPEATANLLFNLIVDELVTSAAMTELNVTADEAAVDNEIAAIEETIQIQAEQAGLTVEEMMTENNFTNAFVRLTASQRVLRPQIVDALLADEATLSEEQLRQEYDANLGAYTRACVRHILLDTEAEAQTALDRATAGESFADLAAELSTGPSGPDGGDLGCGSPDQYVAEFRIATIEAPIGEAIGPVQTQFGFHVILVEERDVSSFDDVRDTIISDLTADPLREQEALAEWVGALLAAATVEIDEQYGTWSSDPATNNFSVVPAQP